jgi:hypothetical protein
LVIQTHVTNFITNKLFGRGDQWLGKIYFQSDGKDVSRKGQNRFIGKGGARLDRTFDCYIDKKSALSHKATSQSAVIVNNYAKHCPKWSPSSLIWGGMVDELRVIPITRNERKVVLLGMGYFKWSGGVWNAAPFCLVSKQ